MNFLIVGGTRFQGIYLIDELIKSGHQVTVFHRGSHPLKRDGVKEIIGDRDDLEDLKKLDSIAYDWIVDTCGYRPEQIKNLIDNLKGNSFKFCFISSAYVYEESEHSIKEDSKLKSPSHSSDDFSEITYGNFKVSCEEVVNKELANRSLILRPSIISGPGDHSFRLMFWLELTKGLQAKVIVKEEPRNIQIVDVRDLTKFTGKMLNENIVGIFNIASKPIPFSQLLETIGSGYSEVKKITAEGLERLGIQRKDLPYCYLEISENYDISRALKMGLEERSFDEMLEDTRAFETDLAMNPNLKKIILKLTSL